MGAGSKANRPYSDANSSGALTGELQGLAMVCNDYLLTTRTYCNMGLSTKYELDPSLHFELTFLVLQPTWKKGSSLHSKRRSPNAEFIPPLPKPLPDAGGFAERNIRTSSIMVAFFHDQG